jgi:hypothetical protein
MMRRCVRAALPALVLFLAGCGGPSLGKVTGTVTYDGKPLKSGTIIFESKGARPATGKIVDGRIVEVTTFQPNDGAPVGEHKVVIQAVEDAGSSKGANPGDPSGTSSMQTRSLIPAAYGDPETSRLTATIKRGENNLTFELKKDP